MRTTTFALVVVAAAAGGLALTALEREPNTTSSPEAAYTAQMRARGVLAGDSDAALVKIGRGLCTAIIQTHERVVTPVPLDGITADQTRVVIDAATRHLCPDQRPKVAAYLRGSR